jgi:hypothetical protein
MSSDKLILEALARVEHKADLCLKLATMIINAGGGAQILDHPAMTDPENRCPVCGINPKYNIDFFNGVVIRNCGCGTGKTLLDLNMLAPPAVTKRRDNDGTTRDNESDTGTIPGAPGGVGRPGSPTSR